MNIVVLYGGDSAEREVSLHSGNRIAAALAASGHTVTKLDYDGKALSARWIKLMWEAQAVFLALHGGKGEDGSLQQELEQHGILHYTGSAPQACALAMQKHLAKKCVSGWGVPIAQGVFLRSHTPELPLQTPFVLKPDASGSSVGLRFIRCSLDWEKAGEVRDCLCEVLLPGREYTVGVLGNEVLPVVEIRPRGDVYDYWHKYTQGESEELCPAPIGSEKTARLFALARAAFCALGLRDYARIDFREDGDGRVCFLEANTLPGMTQTSLFPLAAKTAGIPFDRLCQKMAEQAQARKPPCRH